MQIKLTIELNGVSVEVNAYFDNDEAGTYLEEVYLAKTSDLEEMQTWADASEKEIDDAVYAAYDAFVKESNEP